MALNLAVDGEVVRVKQPTQEEHVPHVLWDITDMEHIVIVRVLLN